MELTWEQWVAMKKDLRRRFSGTGWILLIYYIILNVAVFVWVLFETVMRMLQQFPFGDPADIEQIAMDAAQSGWGYFLAVAIGMLILLLWKKPRYFAEEIMKKGKPMDLGSFLMILCVFLGGQFLSQMMLGLTEMILNLFGYTIVEGLDALSMDMDDLSIFLYGCLLAPVSEEILFRGVIQRSLMPFGKRFAIFCSALTFGLFHGNLVQAPFAFLVGLVLGYVAAEYNICWAMLLHMINNLVIADMLSRLTSSLPEMTASAIIWLIMLAFALAAAVILIAKRRQIRKWRAEDTIHKTYLNCFFTSAGMIVFTAVIVLMMIYSFVVMVTPL